MIDQLPIKTLFLPFAQQAIEPAATDDKILFINGAACPEISDYLPAGNIAVWQTFKPYAAAQDPSSIKFLSDLPTDDAYDLILILGGKQQKETLHFIARALELLKEGGTLVCAAYNDLGGKRLGKNIKELGVPATEDSKHHARVIWLKKPAHYDRDKAAAWIKDGDVRHVQIAGHTYQSQPGIFGWDKEDKGSALLLDHLPPKLKGKGADFGCGYGYLSAALLRRYPAISALYALDADSRAVNACRNNIAALDHKAVRHVLWEDLTAPLPRGTMPPLDWIVMNPPFHEGKATENIIGQKFISAAAQALKPRGSLWMVANSHLPYEEILRKTFKIVNKQIETGGFKIFEAVR